jgi:hypothetical protein
MALSYFRLFRTLFLPSHGANLTPLPYRLNSVIQLICLAEARRLSVRQNALSVCEWIFINYLEGCWTRYLMRIVT